MHRRKLQRIWKKENWSSMRRIERIEDSLTTSYGERLCLLFLFGHGVSLYYL